MVPLLDAIDAFKAAEGLAASESRVALLPPEGVLDADAADGEETDEVVLRQKELVEELQRACVHLSPLSRSSFPFLRVTAHPH